MYVLNIIRNSILYIGFTYRYVSRIIFRMVLSTWLHTTFLYEGLDNVFVLPNLQTPSSSPNSFKFSQLLQVHPTPSSSPKLYLFHFKTLLWCLLKTNFYHSNFAKLLHTHMTLNRSKILVEHRTLCLLPSLKISAHLTS